MDGKHQQTENMDVGPGNGTYDMRSNPTKLGGMGAGATTMTGVLIDTIWERTRSNCMGQDTRWLDFAMLARKSSLRWTAVLIQKLWDISWDMWEHWNKELHSGGQVQLQIIHSTVNAQIVAAFASRAQQLPQDTLHLLHSPVKTVLKYPLASKQAWLESIHAAQQH